MPANSNSIFSSAAPRLSLAGKAVLQVLDQDDIRRVNRLFIPLFGVALGAAVWVGWMADAVGPVLLWVFASLATGGTAGFLFGIPKAGITQATESDFSPASSTRAGASVEDANISSGREASLRARPNTNLEEVSDWLTKILVGLTLVNLKDLRDGLKSISAHAASVLRPAPTASDVSAATALVVGFALLGFLAVYLYMRLFVQGAIVRADKGLNQYRHALQRAEQIDLSEPEPSTNMAEPVVPSAASVRAAQDVADVAPTNRPELVLQPLRQLAIQYEELRQVKEYSPQRTRQMTEIVRRMRPHAIAAAPYIEELIKSTSTGEHLAACIILQMKYMPERMEWLARRLVEERAFIAYQAASALLARTRLAGVTECQAIQNAVAKAKEDRAAAGAQESSLDSLINQILTTN
jgi:hypothetical protein